MARVLFVYGTLRNGGVYHHVLGTSKYLGTAEADGRMYSLGRFPAAQFYPGDDGSDRITGELYDVSIETLDKVDSLEGFFENRPEISLYVRRKIPLRGVDRRVWAYEFRSELEGRVPRIPHGDWIRFLREGR